MSALAATLSRKSRSTQRVIKRARHISSKIPKRADIVLVQIPPDEELLLKDPRTETAVLFGRTAGFTLLEVLIAFTIALLAVAALMQAISSGLASSRAAAHYQEAVSRARSHLDLAIHGTQLVPGDTQGDDGGGFHWRLRVAPAASTTHQIAGLARKSATTVTLYAVSVAISWRDGNLTREVRLDSAQVVETRL
jgi:general secretion pathway protein I